MSKKTLNVDSRTIDHALNELVNLVNHLDRNPKKTRREQNTIRKIEDIRNTIQDAIMYAKLKKSLQ